MPTYHGLEHNEQISVKYFSIFVHFRWQKCNKFIRLFFLVLKFCKRLTLGVDYFIPYFPLSCENSTSLCRITIIAADTQAANIEIYCYNCYNFELTASIYIRVNSFSSHAASMQHRFLSSLLWEMPWRQIGAKPFLKAMLTSNRLDTREPYCIKISPKISHFQ